MVQALWKTVWLFLTEVNRLISYSSAIAPLCIYSSELKIYVYTKTPHRRLIITLFITAKTWEQPRCPTVNEWNNKLVYPGSGTLFNIKRNELSSYETQGGTFNSHY